MNVKIAMFVIAAFVVATATPGLFTNMVAAQSASSTGAATDYGSATSSASGSYFFGDSSSSSSAGQNTECNGGAGFTACRGAR